MFTECECGDMDADDSVFCGGCAWPVYHDTNGRADSKYAAVYGVVKINEAAATIAPCTG